MESNSPSRSSGSLEMIGGRSAYRWSRIFQCLGIAVLALSVLLGALMLIAPAQPNAALVTFKLVGIVVWASSFVPAIGAGLITDAQARWEASSGYTTLRTRYNSMPQLNDKNGQVLREAGNPPLTRRQFRLKTAASARVRKKPSSLGEREASR